MRALYGTQVCSASGTADPLLALATIHGSCRAPPSSFNVGASWFLHSPGADPSFRFCCIRQAPTLCFDFLYTCLAPSVCKYSKPTVTFMAPCRFCKPHDQIWTLGPSCSGLLHIDPPRYHLWMASSMYLANFLSYTVRLDHRALLTVERQLAYIPWIRRVTKLSIQHRILIATPDLGGRTYSTWRLCRLGLSR
jgi:hypothetical protein